jgi:uncharacterized membrane protein HdeD (DUF308 family)
MPTSVELRRALRHELEVVRGRWFWFLLLGIALVVFGCLAVSWAFLATLATITFLSVLLLLGGLTNCLGAFWARDWSGFFTFLLGGVLYIVIGVLMIERPLAAAAGLTLLIASLLMISGLFRIIAAVSHRFDGWGMLLASGVITLLLGLMIAWQWPLSGVWVIGTFVGVEMLISGWNWIFISLLIRKLPKSRSANAATAV